MKVGLIARGEDRGLGTMTREWARNFPPDRTLLVIPIGVRAAGLATHLSWYDNPTCLDFDGELNERVVKDWLTGLDVVYTAETFYDWRMVGWARELGVKTVCHVMPEYFRPDWPEPDAWWNPTPYRQNALPNRCRVVPVPVPLDRFSGPRRQEEVPTWLHSAGARAPADRNGTMVFLQALSHLRNRHRVIVRIQGERIQYPQAGPQVEVEMHTTPLEDYWRLFDQGDVMVMPRRYGGLCLPVNEAMGAGLAVVMPKVVPNLWWPIIPVDAEIETHMDNAAGSIPIAQTNPVELAALMDELAEHPEQISEHRAAAWHWARDNSWAKLRPTIEAELAAVCR